MRARTRLGVLYAGAGDDAARRAGKQQVIEALKADYVKLRAAWGLEGDEARRYDEWFYRDLNNARLGSVAVYTEYVPGFARLLARAGGDMQKFHTAVRQLAALPREQRKTQLMELAAAPSR